MLEYSAHPRSRHIRPDAMERPRPAAADRLLYRGTAEILQFFTLRLAIRTLACLSELLGLPSPQPYQSPLLPSRPPSRPLASLRSAVHPFSTMARSVTALLLGVFLVVGSASARSLHQQSGGDQTGDNNGSSAAAAAAAAAGSASAAGAASGNSTAAAAAAAAAGLFLKHHISLFTSAWCVTFIALSRFASTP